MKEATGRTDRICKRTPHRFIGLNKLIIAWFFFCNTKFSQNSTIFTNPTHLYKSCSYFLSSLLILLKQTNSVVFSGKPVYSRDVGRGEGGDDDRLKGKSGAGQGVVPDVGLHLALDPPHQDVHAAVDPDVLRQVHQESCFQGS